MRDPHPGLMAVGLGPILLWDTVAPWAVTGPAQRHGQAARDLQVLTEGQPAIMMVAPAGRQVRVGSIASTGRGPRLAATVPVTVGTLSELPACRCCLLSICWALCTTGRRIRVRAISRGLDSRPLLAPTEGTSSREHAQCCSRARQCSPPASAARSRCHGAGQWAALH